MVVCWKCGHEFDDTIEYCVKCGAINAIPTPTLDVDRLKKSDMGRAIQAQLKGAGLLDNKGLVELVIGDESIVVPLESRVMFGRDFEDRPELPSIDLTRFDAIEAGVSRRHAAIQRNHEGKIVLMDLGSTNGTYLNQQHLKPLQEYPLSHGDVIHFGNLEVIIQIGDE